MRQYPFGKILIGIFLATFSTIYVLTSTNWQNKYSVLTPVPHQPIENVVLLKSKQLAPSLKNASHIKREPLSGNSNSQVKLISGEFNRSFDGSLRRAPISMTKSHRVSLSPVLLSLGKTSDASVRGNLGPAEVVTSESVDNWLTDRWQGKCWRLIVTTIK